MVSITKNAVFVHVPKNGGSSISSVFGGVDQYWPMHVPWRTLKDNVQGRPGFGFIRDPWHRMVSLYYFLLRSPYRHRQRVKPEQMVQMGFKKWLMEGETFMSNEPVDGQIWIRQNQAYLDVGPKNTYPGIEHLPHETLGMPPMQRRPSMWWLDGLPMQNIGKVENVQQDLNRIADRLRGPTPRVPIRNVTNAKPVDWWLEYDTESADFVQHWHAWDIKVGGYKRPKTIGKGA